MSTRVAILDYDAGNLTSVAHAVRHVGGDPVITRDPEEALAAGRLIFPGVGAAGASMESIRRHGVDEAVVEAYRRGLPILGICIGCQVVLDRSEEDGGTSCLGLIRGTVRRFQFGEGIRRKVPHMGWNEVTFDTSHPVFAGIPAGSQFYFVHSYYPAPDDPGVVQGAAVYGDITFPAALAQGSLAAVQFHTEKSGPPGLKILASFLGWRPA